MMSLVATDVQGSTELWEWNNFVADNAMVVHDETMRSQLGEPYEYKLCQGSCQVALILVDRSGSLPGRSGQKSRETAGEVSRAFK